MPVRGLILLFLTTVIVVSGLLYWQHVGQQADSFAAKQEPATQAVSHNSAVEEPALDNENNNRVVAVPRQSTSTSSADPQASSSNAINETRLWLACSQTDSCTITNQTEPRAGHFEVVKNINEQLDILIFSAQRSAGANTDEFGQLAREAIAFPDGHVQAKAIELMGLLEPQAENVGVIIEQLEGHSDATLFRLSINELTRYPQAQRDIDSLMMETMKTGGHFSAQSVAQYITPLINTSNLSDYQTFAATLDQQTKTAKLLNATLAEYAITLAGG